MAKPKPKQKPAFYALNAEKVGMGGVVTRKPKFRKQHRRAQPAQFYAVVFFPKITQIGPATLAWPRVRESIANSPEAAKMIFMDGLAKGQKWARYHAAGHRVRKIKIVDLGDAK